MNSSGQVPSLGPVRPFVRIRSLFTTRHGILSAPEQIPTAYDPHRSTTPARKIHRRVTSPPRNDPPPILSSAAERSTGLVRSTPRTIHHRGTIRRRNLARIRLVSGREKDSHLVRVHALSFTIERLRKVECNSLELPSTLSQLLFLSLDSL